MPMLIALILAAAVAPAPSAIERTLPDGEGRRPFVAACNACHALTVITGQHYSEAKWTEVVDRMSDRGAKVSDADYDLIVSYLARNFGPPK